MAEQASVNIPKDLLEPIIREHIHAGIVAALGDPAALISQVVEQTLSRKVNHAGDVSQYSHDNKYSLIEAVARNAIHAACKRAVESFIEERRPDIEKAVKAAISKRTGAFSKALVDGLVEASRQSWSFQCNITMPHE